MFLSLLTLMAVAYLLFDFHKEKQKRTARFTEFEKEQLSFRAQAASRQTVIIEKLESLSNALFEAEKRFEEEKQRCTTRFQQTQKMYEDLCAQGKSRQAVLVDMLKSMSSQVDGCYDTFNEIVSRFEGMSSAAEDQNAILRDAAERIVVHSAGLKASFSVLAGCLASLSNASGNKIPSWFALNTKSGKSLSSKHDDERERVEFEYGDKEVVSRTYRDGRLFCEVKHDEFGGVKEGTLFDASGSPARRFVYDGSEKAKGN